MITWLRYVSHYDIDQFSALGWRLSDDLTGTHHGKYSVIMFWGKDGEPEVPA